MPSHAHLDALLRHKLDRRDALRRSAALGLGAPALAAWLTDPARVAAFQAVAPPTDAPIPPESDALAAVDPYEWLEHRDDPEVIAHLTRENAYSEDLLDPLADLRETLFQELITRTPRTAATLPTPWNGYLYYQRTEEGKDYEIVCRRQGSMDAPEQILLDLNTIPHTEPDGYRHLYAWQASPDNRYLAYSLDTTGARLYTLFVLDTTGERPTEALPPSVNAAWSADSQSLSYCEQAPSIRPFRLKQHTLGADPADDLLLYEEADEAFWLGLTTSKDRAFHFLLCQTADTTEVWALASDAPRAPLIPIASRATKHVYAPEHHDGEFLILTNEDAPNFKLMAAPVANPARANWREVIPHDPAVLLYVVEPFARHLVIYGREKGFSQIWVRDMATGATTPVPFAEETYTAGLTSKETGGGNPEFAAARVRVTYSSLVTPESVYEIDLESGQSSLLAQMEILGGHDPGRYVTERLFATAPDGTQIPISLVYLRDAPPDLPPGPRPLRLDGYGGYAQSQDPTFVPSRLSLIDRGISYAIAHVRGGFELGGHWWEEGRLLNKKNCFSDFIACAEHLIAWGHTAPGRLAIYGSSNGGLLMGVVANQRPDLFRAVVAEVPLVDVPLFLLRTGAIGLSNQSELGDPGDAEVLEYQLSYSPYQNVVPQVYPAIFATGGFNDTNIPYWMPAKWMAKLRDSNSGEHPLLLRLLAGGHLGETSYTEFERETALIYAFVINALGLAGPPLRASDAAAPPSAVNRPDAATQDAAAIPAR